MRLLQIHDGWNDLSSNLLACPPEHIREVFAGMQRAKKIFGKAPQFTGGLEAKRLEWWMVQALRELKPKQMFFAYDTPDDLEPLRAAGRMLIDGGFTIASHCLRCYVLCGYPADTFKAAADRMAQTIEAGFMPMAMLYRDATGHRADDWMRWARQWARPAVIAANCNKIDQTEVEINV
jgi:hypothetical protein